LFQLIRIDESGLAILWDLAEGKMVKTFTGHQGPITTIDFSRDNTTAFTGSLDSTIRCWDIQGNLDKLNEESALKTFYAKSTDIYELKAGAKNILQAVGCFRMQ
jgi:WD40 repeat protein